MSIILPSNHLFLTIENDIKTICNPLFKQTKITMFNGGRFFDDGSFYMFSSEKNIVSYLCEGQRAIVAPPPLNLIRDKFYYLIPTAGTYSQIMHDVSSFFNITYPINFYEQKDGYIDIFCFATAPNNDEIVNFYFNNLDYLENFILYFKEKFLPQHKLLMRQRILLPKNRQLNFNSQSIVQSPIQDAPDYKHHYLNIENRIVMLTKRENDCLKKLILGYSAKEIAKLFAISPRTVEDYIQNAKGKIGYSKKSDIVRIMRSQDNAKLLRY